MPLPPTYCVPRSALWPCSLVVPFVAATALFIALRPSLLLQQPLFVGGFLGLCHAKDLKLFCRQHAEDMDPRFEDEETSFPWNFSGLTNTARNLFGAHSTPSSFNQFTGGRCRVSDRIDDLDLNSQVLDLNTNVSFIGMLGSSPIHPHGVEYNVVRDAVSHGGSRGVHELNIQGGGHGVAHFVSHVAQHCNISGGGRGRTYDDVYGLEDASMRVSDTVLGGAYSSRGGHGGRRARVIIQPPFNNAISCTSHNWRSWCCCLVCGQRH